MTVIKKKNGKSNGFYYKKTENEHNKEIEKVENKSGEAEKKVQKVERRVRFEDKYYLDANSSQ